ncbi:probable JmjC domain-containing histone demethylation protein 2C [Oncorhynchus keta]|uniref:probable JmjC domain-containing histone demethylation protein 2C n=1 Tax=Oncorhynchus keta TaxID=8018 RepID=UPI00227B50D8|nr:probable JmjC domain-containing histone demethylation protein 2C [Oncorhynchus keta]XP_052365599.1 probable JmjC domain-containing histone demethylation protein 2C [Oncorhynchus keta]
MCDDFNVITTTTVLSCLLQPVLVTGLHKPLNAALWKADSFNLEFADHQGDLLNCKDGLVSNSGINEFWDGFEDLTKRPKSKDGDTVVYRLKDWPSGEEFMALMPSRSGSVSGAGLWDS